MTENQRICYEECGYLYKFSVVMAVYNVENYLNEAVDSLIHQNIGFEKNIQLILINDGSSDNSGAICDKYSELYPHNIFVLHKENGGVSTARNAGIKLANGRYINFLDPDDKLAWRTLKAVYSFFSANEAHVDVVTIPRKCFEGWEGVPDTNQRFRKGTRVIDLDLEHQWAETSSSTSFFKSEEFDEVCFDENLAFSEDTKVVFQILLKKHQIGAVSGGLYYQRVRNRGDSATQGAIHNKKYWIDSLRNFHLYMYKFCIEKYGYIPLFVQYKIIRDLLRKIKLPHFPTNVLTSCEEETVLELIADVLRQTDASIIQEQRIPFELKHFLLAQKYDAKAGRVQFKIRGNALLYENLHVCYLENLYTHINFIELNQNTIKLDGYMSIVGPLSINKIQVKYGDILIDTELTTQDPIQYSLGKTIAKRTTFRVEVPLRDKQSYEFELCCTLKDGTHLVRRALSFGSFAPLTGEIEFSYYYKNGYKLSTNKKSIKLTKCNFIERIKAEILFLKNLWKLNKLKSRRAIIIRLLHFCLKPFVSKEIWLISDKEERGGDNGESLFRFLCSFKDKNIKPIFVVSKNSVDYETLKSMGTVIPSEGHLYKFIYLFADKIISAYNHREIINPYVGTSFFYADIIADRKIVFLQHGITKDDVSANLNRYKKNYKLFVTSTTAEYRSLLEYPYGYLNGEVQLTGLPRFDLLYNNPKKIITIMPTWREYLFASVNSTYAAKAGFERSSFCKFYSSLLQNNELLDAMKRYGYEIHLALHPILLQVIEYFAASDCIKILHSIDYKKQFAETELLITDYSSVAFDFSYLRKPVIYTHFDYDEYRSNHYTEGYFDYVRDGFGEVETTLDGTVSRIIEYMKTNCTLKEIYRERIESTFPFNDKNNCQRVYDAIKFLR